MIPMTVSLSDFHLSVGPDQSSFVSVPAPVSPVDSIGKFIGERLVTPQCPGPRLMPGMQLYPVSI